MDPVFYEESVLRAGVHARSIGTRADGWGSKRQLCSLPGSWWTYLSKSHRSRWIGMCICICHQNGTRRRGGALTGGLMAARSEDPTAAYSTCWCRWAAVRAFAPLT